MQPVISPDAEPAAAWRQQTHRLRARGATSAAKVVRRRWGETVLRFQLVTAPPAAASPAAHIAAVAACSASLGT